MREKSPRSNLRKRLLILRKKLERTASFPKKMFLGISPSRLILPPNSLRAAPAGAASKLSLWLPKNQEVQFGALCLKMREPFLRGIPDAPRHYFSGEKEAGCGIRTRPRAEGVWGGMR